MSMRKLVPSDSAIVQKLNDEAVILDMDSQQYFSLDDVGTAMWDSIVRHGSPEAVVEELHLRYDVEPTVLRRDLDAFIGDLVASGLLTALVA